MKLIKKMSYKKVIMVVIGLLIFFCGFFLGRITKTERATNSNSTASISEEAAYQDAYAKGWICYMNWRRSDPPQYYNSYIYGKQYKNSFTSIREAFFAGFDDAFYTDWNRDPSEEWDSGAIQKRESEFGAYFGAE